MAVVGNMTHKLPGAPSNLPGSPTLFSRDKGQTSVSEDQQPHHDGRHQQTGRSLICRTVETGGEPVGLGL